MTLLPIYKSSGGSIDQRLLWRLL